MKTSFLAWTSFLISVLCHLTIFVSVIFVFPIDPAAHKPKLFFLGPILQQSDVGQISAAQSNDMNSPQHSSTLSSIHNTAQNRKENPFDIKPIQKPLNKNNASAQEKTIMPSTFETSLKPEKDKEAPKPSQHPEWSIPAYRPLKMQPAAKSAIINTP